MTKVEQTYHNWLKSPRLTPHEIKSLERMGAKRRERAFGTALSFGTAGIRGTMGLGASYINSFTIGGAAKAYGQFILAHHPAWAKQGVVLGHDNRHHSAEFALLAAQILGNLGIKVYLFKGNELQPTPFVSYAIRKLQLGGGAIITASHNPKDQNGFKVYGPDGAQLLPEDTNKISVFMEEIDILNVERNPKVKIHYINERLADDYVRDILNLRLRPQDSKKLNVVFTPQHGTSHILIPRIFQNMNINYYEVKAQMTNDPNFSKTRTPNPEDPRAFNRAILLAKRKKADLVVCTDPDADRIGVAVRYKKRYKFLNGNQMAAVYLNYMLNEMRLKNLIPKNAYIVKSVTSGTLVDRIAEKYNINVYETHVGFKNIASFIKEHGPEKCVFAFEESFGFLINAEIARDKDSIQAAMAIVEAANYYKTQNSSLYEELIKLHRTYKSHRSHTYALDLSNEIFTRVMSRLVKVRKLGGENVSRIDDYREGLNNLEPQNLIKIFFKNQRGFVAIRPSGTEAKVKVYLNLVGESSVKNVIFERRIKDDILNYVEDIDAVKITFRSMIKYLVFGGILIGILVTLLFSLYDTSGNATQIFREVYLAMKNGNKYWLILLIFAPNIIFDLTTAIYTIRAMKFLGFKIRMRHAFIASVLATCISAVTPFATGGAIASYWYMRKKGYERSEVMATYFMSSLLYQASLALRTLVFLPLGLYFFRDVYGNGSVSASILLALTLVGLGFDLFATFMIALLTFSKRTHLWIVLTSVHLLEWVNLVKDPDAIKGKYLYEMEGLRGGMQKLWHHKGYLLELMVYQLIPVAISNMFFAGEVVMTSEGLPAIGGIQYIKFITGQNLVRAANNMIPTPGASGTTEWMTSVLYSEVFAGLKNGSITFTALNRLWTYIVPIIVSITLLVAVYQNERINSKIRKKVKNYGLNHKSALVIKNRFRIYTAALIATIFIAGFLTFWYLLVS